MCHLQITNNSSSTVKFLKGIENITNEEPKNHDIVQMWLSELFLLL